MCGISTGIYLETYCADHTSFGHLPAPLQRYEAMLPVCSESSKSAEEQLFAEDVPLQFKFSSSVPSTECHLLTPCPRLQPLQQLVSEHASRSQMLDEA